MHYLVSACFRFIIIGFFILLASHLNAQQRSLKIIGTVENNMNPIPSAKATLYKEGKSVDIIFTKSNGEFVFDLEIGYEYLIEVQKSGLLTKRIAFNTELPDQVEGKWTMEFAMSLFEGCEGVNTSALNDPVDRIKYSINKSDFISDAAYVQKIRGRIEDLLMAIDNCNADKFQDLVEEADALNKARELEKAREKYQEALNVNPDDRYAQKQVENINKQIGVDRKNQQKYDSALSEAERLYAEKQYEAAREKYNEASQAMPLNSYPKEKISEIDRLMQEKNKAEQAKQSTESKYNNLIAQGNAAYTAKNFVAAKSYYEQALQIKPGASFPQQRVTELGPAIEKQKQLTLSKAAGDKSYKEALAMGQSAMQSKNYDVAKQHYNRALTLKPEESYPQQMIKEIDRLIADQQMTQLKARKADAQDQIDEALDEGDAMYKNKNYEGAANAYQKALQLNPKDSYAQQRYNKAKSMVTAADADKQKALAHKEKIIEADALVAAASYQQAIAVYQQALLAKPGDAGLQAKLANAEQQLATQQQKQASTQAKKKEYDQLLAQGNNYFSSTQYANAKQSFEKALAIFPAQAYPRNKIQEIDAILTKNQKEQQYKGIVVKADNLMKLKEYPDAKSLYQQALAIKTGDSYAQLKITEIDGLLGERKKLAAEQKAKQEQYNKTIQDADNRFKSLKYTEAKTAYQQALGLKPSEAYPKTQITKIEARIAAKTRLADEQKAKEFKYDEAISLADRLYGQNKLGEAKTQYERALSFKSDETYPTGQLVKINSKLAQIEKTKQEKAAFEQRYKTAIAAADIAYDKRDYQSAKSGYMQALNMKPSETYPRQRLNKIAEFERIMAQKEAARNAAIASAASSAAATPKPSKLTELIFVNNSEKDKYLNKLKKEYPPGVTLEIYKEKTKTTERFVVYRGDEIREFRKVKFNWGGVEYSLNGKPITLQYFNTQVKARDGEYFKEINL